MKLAQRLAMNTFRRIYLKALIHDPQLLNRSRERTRAMMKREEKCYFKRALRQLLK